MRYPPPVPLSRGLRRSSVLTLAVVLLCSVVSLPGWHPAVLPSLPGVDVQYYQRNVRAPAFYSYTAPEPEGLTDQPLRPEVAFWAPEGGTTLLMYDDLRRMDSPKPALLDFLESAYLAGAKTAGWDVEAFRTTLAY